jgi:hypothetical protein
MLLIPGGRIVGFTRDDRIEANSGASCLSRSRADLAASSTGARIADAPSRTDRNAEPPFS